MGKDDQPIPRFCFACPAVHVMTKAAFYGCGHTNSASVAETRYNLRPHEIERLTAKLRSGTFGMENRGLEILSVPATKTEGIPVEKVES